jgi:hypothetical protein
MAGVEFRWSVVVPTPTRPKKRRGEPVYPERSSRSIERGLPAASLESFRSKQTPYPRSRAARGRSPKTDTSESSRKTDGLRQVPDTREPIWSQSTC